MPIRNFNTDWVFPELNQVPGVYQAAIGGSSFVAAALYRKGLTKLDAALAFLDPSLYTPASPDQLPGVARAADRLAQAISHKQEILIWGDFDVDGQTSTTLLYSGLSDLGAKASYYIPVRATESHGISLPALKQKIDQLQPKLILTCDTGIDEAAAVKYAQSREIDFIITDHHQLPPTLPDAQSVINPNLLEPSHPLFHLPGVGVAFKLMEELYYRYGHDASHLLDLVALGIVADVAVQTGDTRYLLQLGLDVLRNSPRPGLEELYKLSGISAASISEEDIGFGIGPRLNALGRLGDANPSVEFLTTQDRSRAQELASYLDRLNTDRQRLTEEIYQDSLDIVEQDPALIEAYPVIVLAGPSSWNPGVIGIVASRLVERFHKPVIMLTPDGDNYRGSARSIPGVHITELIAASSALLNSFGGHPMAAGLALPADNLSPFRTSLGDNFIRLVGDLPDRVKLQIDAELGFQEVSIELIRDINRLAPFGPGNPKPLFSTRGAALSSPNADKIIGRNQNHRKLTLADSTGDTLDFLWWNSTEIELPAPPLDVAYSLDLTSFRNQTQVQVTLRHVRQSPLDPVYIQSSSRPLIHDLRDIPHQASALKELLAASPVQIWSEFIYPPGFDSCKRIELQRHPRLVVWTAPPNRYVLTETLKRVQPKDIFLFFNDPSFSSVSDFIISLLGLLKHLESTGKPYHAGKFAQALAVPIDCIETGLEWIHLHGDYPLPPVIADTAQGQSPEALRPGFEQIDRTLKMMLREIIAYRQYFFSAPIEALL